MAIVDFDVAQQSTLNEVLNKITNNDHGLLAVKQSMSDVAAAVVAALSGLTGATVFTSDGTFTVPDGVTILKINACASGGALYAGEYCIDKQIKVTPGEKISITCGLNKNTVIGKYVTLTKASCSESLNADTLGLSITLGISGGSGTKGSGYSFSGDVVEWSLDGGAGGAGGYGGAFGFGGGGGGGGHAAQASTPGNGGSGVGITEVSYIGETQLNITASSSGSKGATSSSNSSGGTGGKAGGFGAGGGKGGGGGQNHGDNVASSGADGSGTGGLVVIRWGE